MRLHKQLDSIKRQWAERRVGGQAGRSLVGGAFAPSIFGENRKKCFALAEILDRIDCT